MAKLECVVCGPVIGCCPPSGLDDYLLVGGSYLNNQISLLFQCPIGYVCTGYPKLITILAGEIVWSPPPFPTGLPLTIQCCDGPLTVQYDPNISQTDYVALLQSMVNEAARRLAGCREKSFRPKPSKQTNDAQTIFCPNGDDLFNISGLPLGSFLPSSVKITSNGKGLIMAAGTFTVENVQGAGISTLKAKANQMALDELTKLFNNGIANGKLQCGVIAAPCDLSVPDNTILATVGIANLVPLNATQNFGSFDPMEFVLEYQNGCFNYDVVTAGFLCPGQEYSTGGHEVFYNNGGSSAQLTQLGTDRSNVIDAPGCPVQIANCSFVSGVNLGTHTHQGGLMFLKFTGWGGYAATTRHNGAPNPTWALRRTRRFAVPPSTRIRVQNYSSFANARWTAAFGTDTTIPLPFNATAGQVQSALNAIASISSIGGVTVAGSLAAGWQVTWNNNGARALLTALVTTVTFAPLFVVTENTAGNAGTKEVQTILLTLDCPTAAAGVGAEWDGTMPNRTMSSFTQVEWKADPIPGNLSLNNGKKLYTAEVRYSNSLGAVPTLAPSGCGWVLTIGEMDGGASFILLWQGVKGTNNDGPGVYLRNDIADIGDGTMCRLTAGPPSVEMETY